ncbi:MAG: 4Fe-4S binding protein, partial [Candidatus Magasanikbacteria bacterium]|nr:4Fe-4S binding protein [Candidatus Magasanikbacteria bacterium]
MEIIAKPGSTKINKTGGWRTYIPEIDHNKCISCGLCSRVCPESCIE